MVVLKGIGIFILVVVGIVVLFLICFLGSAVIKIFAYMIGFVFRSCAGVIFGAIFVFLLLYLIIGLF